ncbi:MAG: DUF3604 domain-containing protein [Armatimonadota bacterium]|nr:DUF3604 domain-containing protein [Armatimonadota bacterium]
MSLSRRDFIKKLGLTGAAFIIAPTVSAEESQPSPLQDAGFELLDHQVLSSDPGSYADNPVLSSDGKGRAWLAWLQRLENDKETIAVREYHGEWKPAVSITPIPGRYESPCLACGQDGHPLAVWLRLDGSRWNLESSLCRDGKFLKPTAVGSGAGKPWNPCLVSGRNGSFWLAWEVYSRGKFRIRLKEFRDGRWGRAIDVTDGRNNAYDPAPAVDLGGRVWIAYSAVKDGSRNVFLTAYNPGDGSLDAPVVVSDCAGTPAKAVANSKPSVICDADNGVWIAYQHSAFKERGSYHGKMEVRAVRYRKGELSRAVGEMDDSQVHALAGANDHFPVFAQGAGGALCLFSRNSLESRRTWEVRASRLDGSGWSKPLAPLCDAPLGRLARPAVCPAQDGSFWLAWQSDDYWGVKNLGDIKSRVHVARVVMDSPSPVSPVRFEKAAPVVSDPSPYGRPRQSRRRIRTPDRDYTLLFGNLHEHSLISKCWADGSDGTSDDNYRYGMDAEGYDFMAITDHCFNLYEAAWRKTRRAASFYNDPPYFVALPAYEWTLGKQDKPPSSGHRNIIFASDKDAGAFLSPKGAVYHSVLDESNRMDKVWQLMRDKRISAVTIPHHPAMVGAPMDWDFHDPHYQSVVEIYQCRHSSEYRGCPQEIRNPTKHEGSYVQDALALGHRLGFIASGDHNAMGIGLAAILVEEVSQRGIVEALLARRCYATTGDKIFLDFRVDGHLMGEEYVAAGKPRISAIVECEQPIINLVVFKNNKVVHEMAEGDLKSRKILTVDFVDEGFSGNSYYYLRVIQDNKQIAWSSPVWANYPSAL